MPFRLVLDIKLGWRREGVAQPSVASVDPDELASRAVAIKSTGLSAAVRFAALNDVLVEANYLPTYTSKCFVLSQTLLAKASVLNDGVSPIRGTLQHTLISMNNRRAWAQTLVRHAARYADSISDHGTAARAYHVIAVAYNARNLFPQAIAGHRRALTYIDSCRFARRERTAVSMLRSRILRESAVCMVKRSAGSTAAAERIHESLALTRASGDSHAIDDALIRCCETHTYLGDYRAATSWLDELYANWSRMEGNLRTIATKLAARLHVCRNEETAAWAAIERGQVLAAANGLQHQRYHFKRLIWHLQEGCDDPRQTILT
ncbi:MAG: hypothetical protein J5J06_09570 [Phycisphaerae bacterium]|nr:hypothetical protein [Phycisphaerae bacterium]